MVSILSVWNYLNVFALRQYIVANKEGLVLQLFIFFEGVVKTEITSTFTVVSGKGSWNK